VTGCFSVAGFTGGRNPPQLPCELRTVSRQHDGANPSASMSGIRICQFGSRLPQRLHLSIVLLASFATGKPPGLTKSILAAGHPSPLAQSEWRMTSTAALIFGGACVSYSWC